jgi:hypothetical protein
MEKYEDPEAEENSEKYWSGKECIVKGCSKPAGTAWSPHWCFKHNVQRLNNITKQFTKLTGR